MSSPIDSLLKKSKAAAEIKRWDLVIYYGNQIIEVAKLNADIEYFGTVRGRAGLTARQWLFYVTGGYAYGHVEGGMLLVR